MVVLFTIVLRIVINYITEPTPSDAFIILCNIVVLIIFKVLSNIVVTIKELIVVEFTIY